MQDKGLYHGLFGIFKSDEGGIGEFDDFIEKIKRTHNVTDRQIEFFNETQGEKVAGKLVEDIMQSKKPEVFLNQENPLVLIVQIRLLKVMVAMGVFDEK